MPELNERILPHFDEHPLRGAKARSFAGFAAVCQTIRQGNHLTREGMTEIVGIAYEMNLGRRRHPQAMLLRALGEVKG